MAETQPKPAPVSAPPHDPSGDSGRFALTDEQKRVGWEVKVVDGVRMKVLTDDRLALALRNR